MRAAQRMALPALCLLAMFLAACAGSPGASATPTPAAPSRVGTVLQRPDILAPYHVFVSDLLTGDVAELGVATWHVSKSVHGLGLSADGKTLFVSDIAGNHLFGYTLDGDGMLTGGHSATVGEQPVHMVTTPDDHTAYVTDFGETSISVVDLTTWQTTKTLQVPESPHSIVLSPDGRTIYAACYVGGAIAIVDTASASVSATVSMPQYAAPYGLMLSNDGKYLYVSDDFLNRLYTVDVAQRRVVSSIALGSKPALIARSPDGKTLYITNGGSHSVSVVDVARDPAHPRVAATVDIVGYPHGLAVTPDGKYVVVANTSGNSLSVIATATNTVAATIPGERYPNDVLIAG